MAKGLFGSKKSKTSPSKSVEKTETPKEKSVLNGGIETPIEHYFLKPDSKLIKVAINTNPLNIIKGDKLDVTDEMWEGAIQKEPHVFSIAPKEIRKRVDLAKVAVKENPLMYKDVNGAARRDDEVLNTIRTHEINTVFSDILQHVDKDYDMPEAHKRLMEVAFGNLGVEREQKEKAIQEQRESDPKIYERIEVRTPDRVQDVKKTPFKVPEAVKEVAKPSQELVKDARSLARAAAIQRAASREKGREEARMSPQSNNEIPRRRQVVELQSLHEIATSTRAKEEQSQKEL